MTETLGRFVSNVVEFVLSGILLICTLVILLHTFFPHNADETGARLSDLNNKIGSDTLVFVVGVAFTYAVGAFAENLARLSFEWRLDQVKAKRAQSNQLTRSYGDMRFAILAKHSELYLEVESQLKRMRIERVVALCQVLLLPATVAQFVQRPSFFWALMILLLVGAILITLAQIQERFNRYCRSIERGYHAI